MNNPDYDPFRPPWAERRRRLPGLGAWWLSGLLLWGLSYSIWFWGSSRPRPKPSFLDLLFQDVPGFAPTLGDRLGALLLLGGWLAWAILVTWFAFEITKEAICSTARFFDNRDGAGENYYLYESGRIQPLLLGNDRAGWCFALNTIPQLGLNALEDWQQLWSQDGSVIVSSRKSGVGSGEMYQLITKRSQHPVAERDPGWWARNNAEPGPFRLARFRVGGICVTHGDGTYDLVRVPSSQ